MQIATTVAVLARSSAKFIILNTEFLVFDTKLLVLNTEFLVFDTKLLVLNTEFLVFDKQNSSVLLTGRRTRDTFLAEGLVYICK